MGMRPRATNHSATAAGAVTGLLLFFLGPLIDAPDPAGSVWLVVCAAGLALAANVFVLGIPAADRKGLWVLDPALLKRAGSFLLAAAAVSALAAGCSSLIQFFEVDRCLDSGGRWNQVARECER